MGHGLDPSAPTVPPKTLKQQLQVQKSKDCEKSLLKASSSKNYHGLRRSRVTGIGALATTI